MSHAKPIGLALAVALLFGGWRGPLLAQSQAYAVQVAALQSPESAEALVNGLRARGLDAYWVKGGLRGQVALYRVRLGKFKTHSQAQAYAEQLRKSGLLDQYYIAAYEPPTKAPPGLASPVLASAPSPDQAPPGKSTSTSASTSASPSTPSPASSAVSSAPVSAALGRAEIETIILIASRAWAAPASPLGASPATTTPNGPASATPTPPATASSVSSAPPSSSLSTSSSSGGSSHGSSAAASAASVGSPPPVANGGATNGPPPAMSPAVSLPAPSTTASGGSEKLPELPELGPPLLRGVVESRNGQLRLVVQNLDLRRPFKGLARVVVDDGKRQSEASPVPLVLRPDEESAFPINATPVNGIYTLIIYDEAGAIRIMRGAPIGAGLPQSGAAGLASSAPSPPPENDVSVVPRQIAATAENITLEFEITSQRPLGYITLTLRVGSSYTDPRRAVLTGTQGRIPFLVPTRLPETGFTYELKDERERVLLTGEDDLRRLVKN